MSRFWELWAHLIGYVAGTERQERVIQNAPLGALVCVGAGGGKLASACQIEVGRRFAEPVLQTLLDNGASKHEAAEAGEQLLRESIGGMSASSAAEFSRRLWTLLAKRDSGRWRDRQGTFFFMIQFIYDTPVKHHRILERGFDSTPGADAASSLGLSEEQFIEALGEARKALCRVMCAIPSNSLAQRTLDYWTRPAVEKDICGGKCRGLR
ncbi:hypothetical protein F0U62_49765 [Cystobacter fuscus]|uniref:hypothetical protein n=1 Tax=Cystobacter fuscus TaxID=43 RepID=UPI002B288017|nr:hypothetical protein F0U62_49765 [Cystobacter fuscus]